MFLVVPASLPVKSVGDLLAMVAARPGATTRRPATALPSSRCCSCSAGAQVVNARYKGDMQAMTDLLGGQVQMSVHRRNAGARLRARRPHPSARHAAAAAQCAAARRAERGRARARQADHHALGRFLPGRPGCRPGSPRSCLAALQQTLKDPAVHERLTQQGFEGYGMSPAKFAEFFRAQHDAFVSTVREHGVSFE